jgi:4-diphosphocytidyl-2-C-methyl-D-erythritol kinase
VEGAKKYMKITVLTPAKINLRLTVGDKLPNGYHEVDTVMQAVTLFDVVDIELSADSANITISVSGEFAEGVPTDSRNLCYKAAAAISSDVGFTGSIHIHITKHIPHGAGLGGGSSDAAAVLAGLNALFGAMGVKNAPLPDEALELIACSLGADVPFFIKGGCKRATGIGMDLSPADEGDTLSPDVSILIAKGKQSSPTAAAYKKLDETGYDKKNFKPFYNSFNDVVTNDEIVFIKKTMKEAGAEHVCLAGSGSAVFGVYNNKPALFRTKKILRESLCFAESCEVSAHGSKISWVQI